MFIPKVIHFVWAGGERQLPKKNLETVLDWAQRNSDFAVKIWVDPNSCSGGMRVIIEKYRSTYHEMLDELTTENQHISQIDIDRFTFSDISQLNDVTDEYSLKAYALARREIDGLSPNYGLSSDLLRYAILYKEGGAYFDSDVYPGDVTLSGHAVFETNFAEDKVLLCVDPDSQGQQLVGNDAFICTSNNPQIYSILQLAVSNCQRHNEPMHNIAGQSIFSVYCNVYVASEGMGRGMHYYRFDKDRAPVPRDAQIDFTVKKTGPVVIRQIVCSAENERILLEHANIQIIDASLRRVDIDHTNDSAWVNSLIVKGERADMINKAAIAVSRDIVNLGELRLSDTIRQLCYSLDVTITDNAEYNTLLQDFFAVLQSHCQALDLSALSFIQADYFLPNLAEACANYNLPYDIKKSGFFPSFTNHDEPMPLIIIAIVNWNDDEAGKKFFYDLQQHLSNTVLPLLLSTSDNQEKIETYLDNIETMITNTPRSFSQENAVIVALKSIINQGREMISKHKNSAPHAAELFGKSSTTHQEPPNPDERSCCTLM